MTKTTWYDLDPGASELWVVEGPVGIDPKSIDPDHLPPGFRWVSNEEWAANPDRPLTRSLTGGNA